MITECSALFNSSDLKPSLLCFIDKIQNYPDQILDFINNNKDLIKILLGITSGVVKDIVFDLLEDDNPILNNLFELVKQKDSDSNYILDYVKNALNQTDNSFNYVFTNLKHAFNFPGFRELFNEVYQRYKNYLFDIISLFPQQHKDEKDNSLIPLIMTVKKFIQDYQDILIELFYNIVSHFKDYDAVYEDLRKFFLYNCTNTSLLSDLELIFSDEELARNISEIVRLDSKIADIILDKIILDQKLMSFVIKLLNNTKFINELADILQNLSNSAYIKENVPLFLTNIIDGEIEKKDLLLRAFQNIVRNILTESGLKSFVGSGITTTLTEFFLPDFKKYEVGESCIMLFNHTFFNTTSDINDFKFYYAKKLIIDSTKSRNDFLTYENCLNGYDKSIHSKEYQMKPVYVIGKITDRYNQSELKNSIYYEKYNYIMSFCFPQGTNKTTHETLCSDDDYGKLIKIFNSLAHNMNKTEVRSFVLTQEDLKGKPKHYLYLAFIAIVSALPLLIAIFLKLYKVIKLSNYRKDEINNKLSSKNKDNNKVMKTKEIYGKELSIKKIMPKWYRLLNEYFNLVKNGSELFNFSLNQTNFNDFNGITYIKGILGLSMFLNIFGLTFFILSNLPTKILGTYQFYYSVNNLFYILAFVGLRYCPRIIFSCNGYTLIYKFLNFIEHDPNFCFFKFLILQSYKFILLIFVSLYLRFCLYYIDVIFDNIRNPMREIFHNQLEEHSIKYFYYLLSFLFYNIKDDELFTNESVFIQYLYLPINEIFLFIYGIALISIGYKFKLRFDIIIIISFILVYLFKLAIFIFFMHERKIYSTLYFFLHGYGVLMLNPIFNLPSFLVGMYFGLVNFTIQRGVNNINKDEKYKEYELLDYDKQDMNQKRMPSEEKKRFYKIINNNDLEDDKLSRILTFSRNQSSVFEVENYVVKSEKSNISFDSEDEKSQKENLDINTRWDKREINNNLLITMPFLKSTVDFTNFHRRNQDKIILKIILVIFFVLLIFFISVRYIFIHIYITKDIKPDANISDTLSFEKIIPNYFLNILYVIDIEIVVIIINWICFYLYFKGGQINDFLNHIYWSFFIKSYFSYALVSSPVILYIFYQSETVIAVTIFNILLYSLISCFFVFLVVIIFYSFYEYPLRKIFKTLKIRKAYINIDDDEFDEEENDE